MTNATRYRIRLVSGMAALLGFLLCMVEAYQRPTHDATSWAWLILGIICFLALLAIQDWPAWKAPSPEGSTICAHCKKPIVPGTPVAHAWTGAPHPYTHATFACDESGGAMYCGVWGNGTLEGLEKLYNFEQQGRSTVLVPK